jgi:hypothetical protein
MCFVASRNPSVRDNDGRTPPFSDGCTPRQNATYMVTAFRINTMLSLGQAVDSAPPLAALQQRIRHSQRCLEWIKPVLPAGLKHQIKAGPIQNAEWCVLASNASVSAKLRQLLPMLLTTLNQNGAQVDTIRIKVQANRP